MWLRPDVLIVRGRCIRISLVWPGLWSGVRDAAFRADDYERICSRSSLPRTWFLTCHAPTEQVCREGTFTGSLTEFISTEYRRYRRWLRHRSGPRVNRLQHAPLLLSCITRSDKCSALFL